MRYDKETFENYCNEQIKSIKVAISRKANGSNVEDGYFSEHIEKLKEFFLDNEVEAGKLVCDWCKRETSILKKVKQSVGDRFEYHKICVSCWNNEIKHPEEWAFVEEIRS